MEWNFRVGDRVVCIKNYDFVKAGPLSYLWPRRPKEGEYFTLRSIESGWSTIILGLRFEEIICGIHPWVQEECAFDHRYFRKLITIEDFMSKDVSTPVNNEDKVPEHV